MRTCTNQIIKQKNRPNNEPTSFRNEKIIYFHKVKENPSKSSVLRKFHYVNVKVEQVQ